MKSVLGIAFACLILCGFSVTAAGDCSNGQCQVRRAGNYESRSVVKVKRSRKNHASAGSARRSRHVERSFSYGGWK